jgi:hypothetical protein
MGFGSAGLPSAVYELFAALAGARAAIHTASARLFVFATADVGQPPQAMAPEDKQKGDRTAAPTYAERDVTGVAESDSEPEIATQTDEELVPSADVPSLPER